jgi:hypothetical protein
MTLKREVPGFGIYKNAGKSLSKGSGSWSIKKKNAQGNYYVTAKSKTVTTSNGDTIRCKQGRSKNRTVK